MRMLKRALLATSMILGASGFAAASAQGMDSAEAEEPAEIIEETEACADDEDCMDAPVEAEEIFADDAGTIVPETGTTADSAPAAAAPEAEAQGGAVLVTPGSTDESNPGGSTRPGTRPDD
jgi:hypothetical protein